MLSDKDISHRLGNSIEIIPFKKENVEGASIYLTASKLAWSSKNGDYIFKNDMIVIPPNDTALIITNEFVRLDKKHSATCHARLRLTMEGLSYYPTPIKPNYSGKLIIALQNNTDKIINIRVNEKIVTVMFYKLTSPSSFTKDIISSPDAYLIGNGKIIMDDYQRVLYLESHNNSDNKKLYNEFRGKNCNIKRILLVSGLFLLFIVVLGFNYFLPANVGQNIKNIFQILGPITGTAAFTTLIRLIDK